MHFIINEYTKPGLGQKQQQKPYSYAKLNGSFLINNVQTYWWVSSSLNRTKSVYWAELIQKVVKETEPKSAMSTLRAKDKL